jgi:hypothetical protein
MKSSLHAKRHVGEIEAELHSSLTATLDEGLSLKPRPFYPQRNNYWYPSNRRLLRPHTRSGRFAEETNLLPLPGFEDWIVQPVT